MQIPKTISYCSTCKGRLWQLRQTLPANLDKISNQTGVDLVLLDYHSEDGLSDYIFSHFQDAMNKGILKYYRLVTPQQYFYVSYAKNIAHCLAEGEILFNLDSDNFIGETVEELRALRPGHLLINQLAQSFDRGGRIGIHARDFYALRGYNEHLNGHGFDDGELAMTSLLSGFRLTKSADTTIPISNTKEQKDLYFPEKRPIPRLKTRNPNGYGCAELLDYKNAVLSIGFK